jgi:diacylglycerol O-acyltransferase
MRKLSPLDTLFLFLERRHAPFHVGALSLFRPPEGAPPDFAAQLAQRLNQFTRAGRPFNQRLAGRLGMDIWVRDSDFDLSHHFVHLALPKPGRIRELLAMVSRVHSAHLDRAYPLWRTYLIEGLEDGRIATYTKVHHSVLDGVAGIRLMLKSMSADVVESVEMPPPWGLQPSKRRLISAVPGVSGFRALVDLAAQGRHSIPAVFNQIKQSVKDLRTGHPDLVSSFQAPRCLFNQRISGSRRFAARSYSTARIKAVGAQLQGTTNDVVLALCSGALRRYLLDQNALPDEPLIAAVPVSIRRDESVAGNEIAAALINLATHLSDPVQRFMMIKGSMDYNKERFRQMTPAQLLAYTAAMLAPGLLTLLPGVKHTIANVVISHVPGPREPMYWQGCQLEGIYPASLLLDGFALNITLISRHDQVDFGLLACRRSVPRMQRLLTYIEDSLVELESALGITSGNVVAMAQASKGARRLGTHG